LLAGLLPSAAAGQGSALPAPTPLACDFKKVAPGTWARYALKVGAGAPLDTRWAFIGRDAEGNTLELAMEGGGPALAGVGGKVVTRLVLVADPVGVSRPIRRMVMQLGDREPLEVPLDLPGLPGHKFQNPDPKKLVDRPTIRVPAGTFATSHYRETWEDSTVDAWLSEQVPPLGVIKVEVTARAGVTGPGGKPMPPVVMELTGHGKDARPAITRASVPFQRAGKK
jgi:hypothetical protein